MNPKLTAAQILMYVPAGLGSSRLRSRNAKASNQFKLLFNSHKNNPDLNRSDKEHIRQLEQLVRRRQIGSAGKLKFEVMTRSTDRFTI